MWALILASMLWGTTGTAASFLPDSVSPLAVGASTMTIGGLLLFLVSARPALAAVRASSSRRWLLIGAVGVFVYPLAFYSSMSLAGVAIGNVVSLGTGPVFAALLEWIVERRRLTLRWALCTAVAIVGVILLALGSHRDDAPQATSPLLGIGLGVLYRRGLIREGLWLPLGLLALAGFALYHLDASQRLLHWGLPSALVVLAFIALEPYFKGNRLLKMLGAVR